MKYSIIFIALLSCLSWNLQAQDYNNTIPEFLKQNIHPIIDEKGPSPEQFLPEEQFLQQEQQRREEREKEILDKLRKEMEAAKGTKGNPAVAADPQDSLALVALYKATNGDNWKNNSGWLTDSVYKWYGISLNDNGKVINIDLHTNNLIGTLPPQIGELNKLQMLILRYNYLSGGIPPELGKLVNLEWLGLSRNQLFGSIPSEIGNLFNLQGLYLEFNQLSGNIPPELGNLSNLQRLYLSHNQLSGNIPPELGNLSNLIEIHLEWNQLSGNIPSDLGRLSNLLWLFLSSNQLTGNVPSEINNLSNLSELILASNELDELPDLSGLHLYRSDISNNKFDFDDLENANISATYFNYSPQKQASAIRTESGTQVTLSLQMSSLNNNYQWYNLDTLLSGEKNDTFTISNTQTGAYYCKIRNIHFPDLVLTTIPQEIGNAGLIQNGILKKEYDALISFYDATNGDNWSRKDNWKTSLPVTYWYRIFVIGVHVTSMYLGGNQLSGSIPPVIKDLSKLEKISLGSNQLSGNIPPEIGNLSNLQQLYLSHNQLSGNIPPEIGNLSNLQQLYLSHNQLSGNIPSEIGYLSNLQRLYLGHNQLSGNIPPEIGNLSNLESLNLSTNNLSGNIPSEIGNLSNLRWLFLYSNNFDGTIPSEINNLFQLNYITIRDNDFSSLPKINLSVYYDISLNHLDFGDLEFSNIDPSKGLYAPQKTIPVRIDTLQKTDTLNLFVTVDGTDNQYQWYDLDTLLPGDTASNTFVNKTLVGAYHCKIANDKFPKLILETDTIRFNLYYAFFNIHDAYNNPVENAGIIIRNDTLFTGKDGNTNILLTPGKYDYQIFKQNYQTLFDTVTITDTDMVVNHNLNFISYNVSFVITEELDSLKNVQVILGEDTLLTGANGIASFSVVPGKYGYSVTLGGYDSVNDSVTVSDKDTTLNISLSPTKYEVSFVVTDGQDSLTGAQVIFAGDTLITNDSGSVVFNVIPGKYGYKVSKEGYENLSDSLTIDEADTTVTLVLTPSTGVEDLSRSAIKVYPNPSSGRFVIEAAEPFINAQLRLMDLKGNILLLKTLNGEKRTDINLEGWTKGVYILQILNKDYLINTRLIIK